MSFPPAYDSQTSDFSAFVKGKPGLGKAKASTGPPERPGKPRNGAKKGERRAESPARDGYLAARCFSSSPNRFSMARIAAGSEPKFVQTSLSAGAVSQLE